jgi:spermidine synthase
MKPNRKLAETTTPDGGRLALYEHDGDFCIRLNGQDLMHSKVAASELQLGELAAETLSNLPESLSLIGGLGLGFTLKGLLEKSGPGAKVQVAEIIPEIIDWNRNFLSDLNGALLKDSRVELLPGDVCKVIANAAPAQYDALLLDVDNGPAAMVQKQNSRLYSLKGLQQIAGVLKPGGYAFFWSASADRGFAERLARAGFKTKVVSAPLYAGAKRSSVSLYIAGKPSTLPAPKSSVDTV